MPIGYRAIQNGFETSEPLIPEIEYLVFDATEAKFIDVWDEAESA
jgi:hypothetical protein